MIDDRDQFRTDPKDLFVLYPQSQPTVSDWRVGKSEDLFVGSLKYLGRGADDIEHQRSVLFLKASKSWIIEDSLVGSGRHTLRWGFHLHPRVSAEVVNDNIVALHEEGEAVLVKHSASTSGNWKISTDLYSPEYGVVEESSVAVFATSKELPCRFTIEISCCKEAPSWV
jgi:hypothetical protein